MRVKQRLDRSGGLAGLADTSSIESRRRRQTGYLDKLLPHVPLHRALARSAECLLLSEVEWPLPVLDLGCGDGTFAGALFESPLEVGIDPDKRTLRWASRHCAHRSLLVASGAFLPFRSAAFSSVLCNSTLEHIPDQRAVLQEMSRVLAPEGSCLLTVPSHHFFPFHLGCSVARLLRAPALAHLYQSWISRVARIHHWAPPHVWRHRLEEAGFRVVSWRYYYTVASTRVMDAAQYLSVPSFITRHLLGRWVLWPGKGRYLPLARWLAPLAQDGSGDEGAFLLFHCTKDRVLSGG